MAVHALSTGAPTRAPALTRRAALSGAFASVAMVGVAAAATMPVASASPAVSARLQRAMALHDKADALEDWHVRNLHEPARLAYERDMAAAKAEIMEPVPHREVQTTYVGATGKTVRLSTDNAGSVAVAARVDTDPLYQGCDDPDWRQANRELHAAATERAAIISEQERRLSAASDRSKARHSLRQHYARSETLDDRRYKLWGIVATLPATSLADVVAKLDFLDRTNGGDAIPQVAMAVLACDLRRLAKMEG